MKARFVHRCTHVLDREKAVRFYELALGFHVVRQIGPADGFWTSTFMVNDGSPFELELTWNRGRTEPYDNGGKDTHIAFEVDDFAAYHDLHKRCTLSTTRTLPWASTSSQTLRGSSSRSCLRREGWRERELHPAECGVQRRKDA